MEVYRRSSRQKQREPSAAGCLDLETFGAFHIPASSVPGATFLAVSSLLPVSSSPPQFWPSTNSSSTLRILGDEEAPVTHRVPDYVEKELALLENVEEVPEQVGEGDQEPEAVVVGVVSWLPGGAGHDEVLTWAW